MNARKGSSGQASGRFARRTQIPQMTLETQKL